MAPRPFSSTSIGPDVLLRAAGISLVVLDHATSTHAAAKVLAGLNVLLMVAGWSFARFLPPAASAAQIRSALLTYGKGIAAPSLWMLLVSAIVFQLWRRPGPRDWAHVRLQDIALFPAWYPLELVGSLLLLAAVFSLPHVARIWSRWPFAASLGLVALSVGARLFQTALWRAGISNGAASPHIMLWNLTAGMMLFAAFNRRERPRLARLTAALVVAALCWATWGPVHLRTWTTLLAAVLLLATTRLTVPFVLGRFLLILSQASLFVFLLHMPAIWIFNSITATSDSLASFAFAVLGCATAWVVWTAGRRAMRTAPATG